MRVLVTGGAGFIGSHLSEELSKNHDVVALDSLVAGSGNIGLLKQRGVKIIKGDVGDAKLAMRALEGIDVCYHFAADPDVRKSTESPLENCRTNILGTLNILQACRKNNVKKFVFASTSAVYGMAKTPTPETAKPDPISFYGVSKAAGEQYAKTFSSIFKMQVIVFRYANIIGPRLTHGIIYDFFNKLGKNGRRLEILGDGRQEKSYLHVKDCVDATLLGSDRTDKMFEILNVGSRETITVKQIADAVVKNMGLHGTDYKFTGGGGGWPGDVTHMLLGTAKIKRLGFAPKFSINEAIADTVGWLSS
ncbi:MAG: NAD-dependent epimerase/dehydratase family protein [Candidatus Aenigmarchaeota archaeon]|nr:NAD-dependent epimerase/dehydratase family protein [Candidatus Aenigmarchaeota archaeon]